MALRHVRPKPWTVKQFQRLYEQGFFEPGERVELIEGQIVPMSPQNPPHSRGVTWTNMVLTRECSSTHVVRVQLPLDLTPWSEPEPDFALVSYDDMRAAVAHPTSADLIVEVAESSLEYDRDEKASLYARVGIQDYWILNVRHDRLEVYRSPVAAPDRIFEHYYENIAFYEPTETVSPLVRPDVHIVVQSLLYGR